MCRRDESNEKPQYWKLAIAIPLSLFGTFLVDSKQTDSDAKWALVPPTGLSVVCLFLYLYTDNVNVLICTAIYHAVAVLLVITGFIRNKIGIDILGKFRE